MNALPAKPSVLLVEDEYLIGSMLEQSLVDAGYRVVLVGNAAAALAALERDSFGACLLDFRIGTETSAGLARLLQDRGIPFAFCTGATASEVHEHFAGVPVISKPFLDDDVWRVLSSLVSGGASTVA